MSTLTLPALEHPPVPSLDDIVGDDGENNHWVVAAGTSDWYTLSLIKGVRLGYSIVDQTNYPKSPLIAMSEKITIDPRRGTPLIISYPPSHNPLRKRQTVVTPFDADYIFNDVGDVYMNVQMLPMLEDLRVDSPEVNLVYAHNFVSLLASLTDRYGLRFFPPLLCELEGTASVRIPRSKDHVLKTRLE